MGMLPLISAGASGIVVLGDSNPALSPCEKAAAHGSVTLIKKWCDAGGNELSEVPVLSQTVTISLTGPKAWLKVIYPAGDTAHPILTSAIKKPDGEGSSWPDEISAIFNSDTSVTANSTKALSNVVLLFDDCSVQKFDSLSDYSLTFSGTGENAGKTVVGVWIKSGNNKSGDGSGYGTYVGRALMIASGSSYTVTETGLPEGWACASGLGTFKSLGVHDSHTVRNQMTQNQTPAIHLVKTAGTAPDGEVYTLSGAHIVTYTYTVTNTGYTWLKDLAVADDKLGAIGTVAGPIAPGASEVLTVDAMVSSGVTNTGTVVATPCTEEGGSVSGQPQEVSDADQAVVAVLPPVDHESVFLIKEWYDADTNLMASPPALSSTVTVTASNTFAWLKLVYPAGDTLPPLVTSAVLKPDGADASWPDAVSATFDSVSRTVTANSAKDLSNVVLKFADGAEQKFDNLTGTSLCFSGTVANAGKDIAGVWIKSGENAGGDGPGFGSYIAPALMIPAGASYTVTETGLPEGWICTAGLGTFTSNGGNGTHTVKNQMPPDPIPAVRIVKTAGTAPDGEVYTLGTAGSVTYTYLIQNTGNTWLKNLNVTDDKIGVVGTVTGPLAPSASATLTKDATVSAGVTNVGSVSATPSTQAGVSLGLADVTDTDDAVVRLKVLSALGDFVWLDADANGIQDSGEAGIAGVTVSLCAPDGTALGVTAVTGADGGYLFENLLPGSYAVRFTVPAGYVLSASHEGTDDALDSDAEPSTALTPAVGLAEGTTNLTLDAGMWLPQPAVHLVKTAGTAPDGQTYTITGPGAVTYTYAVKNTGNTWLKNLAVTDDKLGFVGVVSGLLGPGEATNLTATANVSGGVTNVGTVTGTPVTPQDDVIPGTEEVSDSDPAVVQVQPAGLASLGDRVWVDADQDGIQDAGEPGLTGVTVTLLNAAGDAVLASAVTAPDGSYLFDNLSEGTYRVRFALPSTSWRFTSYGQGTDGTRDSDASPETGLTPLITLAGGVQDLSWDAGVYGGIPPGFCDVLTVAENYNALIFGNFTTHGGDTEGRLAVGGDAWFDTQIGYSVGVAVYGEPIAPLNNSADMLIVGGDLTDSNFEVNGNVVYGGVRTGIDRNANLVRHVQPVKLDDNGNVPDDGSGHTFDALQRQVELASAMIASMDDRGVVSNEVDKTDHVMTFIGDDPILNVFNVAASDWSGSQMDIVVTAPEYSTVVFNIHGSSVELSNGAIRLTGITNDRILFNYADATDIRTTGFSHEGAVLAPYADGTFSGGYFAGFGVFGGNVTASTGFEFHNYPFRGTVCTEAETRPAIRLETTAGDAADGAVLTVLGGSDVNVSYRVTNVGNTPLDQVRVTDTLLGTVGPSGQRLGAGESATLTVVLPNVTSDTVLRGTVTGRPIRNDGTQWNGYPNVSDTDEATVKIGSPSTGGGSPSVAWQRADFAVTGIGFVTTPTLTGEVFSVQVTVDNHGELAADAGRLTLYLAKPDAATVGEAGVAYKNVGVLMPGESKTLLFQNLQAGSEPGTQHLRAYVDSLDRVREWSEGDNQLSSVYALNSISLALAATPDGVELSWNSFWGQKYTLYRCTDLSKGFLLYKSHVEATPPVNTFIDADVVGMRFYRLVVEQQ